MKMEILKNKWKSCKYWYFYEKHEKYEKYEYELTKVCRTAKRVNQKRKIKTMPVGHKNNTHIMLEKYPKYKKIEREPEGKNKNKNNVRSPKAKINKLQNFLH